MAQNEPSERERRRRGRPFGTLTLAGILIWAGIVLLLDKLKLFEGFGWETWAIIMTGAGVILLVQALIRLLAPSRDRRGLGSLTLGLILLAVGIGNAAGWDIILPIALIIAGLAIFFGGFFRK